MQQSITLSSDEVAQIVGDHLCSKGRIPNGSKVKFDIWYKTEEDKTTVGLTLNWDEQPQRASRDKRPLMIYISYITISAINVETRTEHLYVGQDRNKALQALNEISPKNMGCVLVTGYIEGWLNGNKQDSEFSVVYFD